MLTYISGGTIIEQPPKIEIILINDGSTDKSKKTCNSFKRKFKGIKIFNHRKKLGVSASRNKGIKEAKGDFLIFLDSDDFLLNGCLNKLSNLVKKNTFSDLIIAKKFIKKAEVMVTQ